MIWAPDAASWCLHENEDSGACGCWFCPDCGAEGWCPMDGEPDGNPMSRDVVTEP